MFKSTPYIVSSSGADLRGWRIWEIYPPKFLKKRKKIRGKKRKRNKEKKRTKINAEKVKKR